MKLWHYIFHRPTWQKLNMIPRHYSVDYDLKSVDRDATHLMGLNQIRSPHMIDQLKRRYKVETAGELVEVMPSRRRPRHLGKRVIALINRAMGQTPYDPMKSIALRHRKGRRGQ